MGSEAPDSRDALCSRFEGESSSRTRWPALRQAPESLPIPVRPFGHGVALEKPVDLQRVRQDLPDGLERHLRVVRRRKELGPEAEVRASRLQVSALHDQEDGGLRQGRQDRSLRA